MIERGVEIGTHFARGIDGEDAQRLLPLRPRRSADRIEIAWLAGEVAQGACLVDRRDADLHYQRPRQLAEIQLPHQRAAFLCGDRIGAPARSLKPAVGDVLLHVLEGMAGHRHRKPHGETQHAVGRPAAGAATAGNGLRIAHTQRSPQHLARVIVERASKVQHQMRRLACREGVAVHAHPRPRRHLRPHAIIGQGHRVIARLRDFAVMAEARAVSRVRCLFAARFQMHGLAAYRHDQEIAHVGMAGARKMRVAETLDRGVVVTVARGMGVAFAYLARRVGVGRQLHHAEGRRRAGEGVARFPRSDHGVDGIVRGARRLRRQRGSNQCDRARNGCDHTRGFRQTHSPARSAHRDAATSDRLRRRAAQGEPCHPQAHMMLHELSRRRAVARSRSAPSTSPASRSSRDRK